MSAALRSGLVTFDDFCMVIRPDQKADLIDGVIYMASPENLQANALFLWLVGLLGDFVEITRFGGQVYGSQVAFRMGKKSGPEPDIAYVLKERLHLARRTYFS